MSFNHPVSSHKSLFVDLMGYTQSTIASKPSTTTTVFRLPQGRQHKHHLSFYSDELPKNKEEKRSIESSRNVSPEKSEYGDFLQKFRDRLKLERRQQLRHIYGQGNPFIRGGFVHNTKSTKIRSRGQSDTSLGCPKVKQQKLNDLQVSKTLKKDKIQEPSKFPYLKKLNKDKKERKSNLHKKPQLRQLKQALLLTMRSRKKNEQSDQPYQLVPWKSINQDDLIQCPQCL